LIILNLKSAIAEKAWQEAQKHVVSATSLEASGVETPFGQFATVVFKTAKRLTRRRV